MASRRLNVFLHDRLAGVLLSKDNGNLQFRYDAEYVEGGGQPLSWNLPLRTEAFPHRDCLAFFGNLLPEEGVRAQLALATGISSSNDYRLLERFGGDVAGALTLLPDAKPREGGRGKIEVLSPERLDEILVDLPQRPLAADEGGEVRLSLAGAQSKLPVIEVEEGFALPHGSGHPTTHILKPEPSWLSGLVANEFFCMRLAAEAGLQVAPVERATTVSGLPYLIVTRYDRDLTEDSVRRLHQEDLCQALGKLFIEKYQEDGGPSVVDAMALIDDVSAAPARDRLQLWLALVLNIMIGNCDAHGKNYSLLYDSGVPSLAPLYDLVSTTVYDGLTTRLAMSIDGATRLEDVGPSAWQRLAEEVGFAPRFLKQRMQPFVVRVLDTAMALAADPRHEDRIVTEIAGGIWDRTKGLSPSSG